MRTAYEDPTPNLFSGSHVVAMPNDTTFQVSAIANARSRGEYALLNSGSRSHPAIVAYRDIPDQGDPPSDDGVPSKHRPSLDCGGGVDSSSTLDP